MILQGNYGLGILVKMAEPRNVYRISWEKSSGKCPLGELK
jgi:hypothetical protein